MGRSAHAYGLGAAVFFLVTACSGDAEIAASLEKAVRPSTGPETLVMGLESPQDLESG
jgi:hypothetical protein